MKIKVVQLSDNDEEYDKDPDQVESVLQEEQVNVESEDKQESSQI